MSIKNLENLIKNRVDINDDKLVQLIYENHNCDLFAKHCRPNISCETCIRDYIRKVRNS